MNAAIGRLEARWSRDGGEHGQLLMTLVNLGDAPMSGFRLVYTSLTRNADRSMVRNAELVRRDANYHEFVPPKGLVIAPGTDWTFSVGGLTRSPGHVSDGVSTAYLILGDGSAHDLDTGDLMPADFLAEAAGVLVPEVEPAEPVAIMPWPNQVALGDFGPAPTALWPVDCAAPEDRKALAEVAALARRLFPNAHTPFLMAAIAGGGALLFERRDGLPAGGYDLRFVPERVTLGFSDASGRHHGLVTLAQMLHAAHLRPDAFHFPRAGTIADAPRHGWRACHLDVSRQVYPMASVARFVDILAWHKMNVFHWHLCDDEGWRLEIRSRPGLTRAGARQGPDEKMLPQLGTGARGSGGFYTQDEVKALVAHAARLHVGVLPEFDIPGHCTALLAAYPELADSDERPGNYHSVQGYANNAINPAVPAVYDLLADVFAEAAELFAFPYIHVGGDEVAHGSWLGSPLAQDLMARENLAGTNELQAHLLKRVQEILADCGKQLAGWDEVSHGGGVKRQGTLLMAWQKAEIGLALARDGYDVVMCPGEAYYLDMAQSTAWLEPGLTWAGIAPPQKTYEFEAAAEFPPELAHRLKGVEGCIWSENLVSRQRFNHMVFPRLGAIAEAGWTEKANKNWRRFAALAPLMPEL